MRSTQFFACAIFSAWLMICPMTCVGQESAKVYTLLILDSQLGNPYDEVRGALAKALTGYGYLEVSVPCVSNSRKITSMSFLSAERLPPSRPKTPCWVI